MSNMPEVIFSDGNASCMLYASFFGNENLSMWQETLPWQQHRIRMFGKEFPEPRLTAWMGPAYRYSNIQWAATPLSAQTATLIQRIEEQVQPPAQFNACLFNLYRDGQDAMGWHRDNEPEMDTRCIASVSLGDTRDFVIRHRETKEKWQIPLGHGDLLVMSRMQEDYDHALPRRKKSNSPRLNMTFRTILQPKKFNSFFLNKGKEADINSNR